MNTMCDEAKELATDEQNDINAWPKPFIKMLDELWSKMRLSQCS